MHIHRQTQIEKKLAEIRILSACDAKEISAIAKMATRIDVPAGQRLTEQGHQALEFMIIVSGDASVFRDGEKVAELHEGDFFGEMAVLAGGERTGSVVADTPMELEVVSRRDLLSLLQAAPRLTITILQAVAARLQESDSTGQRYLSRTGAIDLSTPSTHTADVS